jgi:hypothetical protein
VRNIRVEGQIDWGIHAYQFTLFMLVCFTKASCASFLKGDANELFKCAHCSLDGPMRQRFLV